MQQTEALLNFSVVKNVRVYLFFFILPRGCNFGLLLLDTVSCKHEDINRAAGGRWIP
jgi:hypothetical protein